MLWNTWGKWCKWVCDTNRQRAQQENVTQNCSTRSWESAKRRGGGGQAEQHKALFDRKKGPTMGEAMFGSLVIYLLVCCVPRNADMARSGRRAPARIWSAGTMRCAIKKIFNSFTSFSSWFIFIGLKIFKSRRLLKKCFGKHLVKVATSKSCAEYRYKVFGCCDRRKKKEKEFPQLCGCSNLKPRVFETQWQYQQTLLDDAHSF